MEEMELGRIKITACPIAGLYLIEPEVHGDARGYFMETYNARDLRENGLNMTFVQDNQSMSARGVLRGLHYQMNHPQGKLVRAIRGSVFDAVVDLRKGSGTFGKWYGVELSAENRIQFYVSPGFAHGYLVLSDEVEFCYKVTDYYDPKSEGGIAWNDPQIGIRWPGVEGAYPGTASSAGYRLADGTPLMLSARDQEWGGLDSCFRFRAEGWDRC